MSKKPNEKAKAQTAAVAATVPQHQLYLLKLIDKSKLNNEYKCFICTDIMYDDANQADDCGCRYCSKCFDEKVIPKNECPKCHQKLFSSTKIPDKLLRKQIRNEIVKCEAKSCDWSGKLEDFCQTHYKSHINDKLTFKCDFCKRDFPFKLELDKHLDRESGDCPKQPMECPFKLVGCNIVDVSKSDPESMDTSDESKCLTRETLQAHMNHCVNHHLILLLKYSSISINQINAKLVEHENLKITSPGANLEVKIESSEQTVASQQTMATSTMTSVTPTFQSPKSSRDSMLEPKASNEFNLELEMRVTQISNQLDQYKNTQSNLLSDITRLVKSKENLKLENKMLDKSLKDIKQLTQDLHKTLALNQVSILALEERLINLEKLSYDGTLLWKITNVNERIQEAKSGRQTSFYSPPFYTSRNGYKMCVRIYLNGDGNGRNTHLSLFFVILRGDFDALLRWPFRQKVTFVLIDQTSSESKENVYDAFRPDPNSSSFKRPTSDMNIASGLPVFCPLGKLMSSDHEYIKDNAMFIKTIVDIQDLPSV